MGGGVEQLLRMWRGPLKAVFSGLQLQSALPSPGLQEVEEADEVVQVEGLGPVSAHVEDPDEGPDSGEVLGPGVEVQGVPQPVVVEHPGHHGLQAVLVLGVGRVHSLISLQLQAFLQSANL